MSIRTIPLFSTDVFSRIRIGKVDLRSRFKTPFTLWPLVMATVTLAVFAVDSRLMTASGDMLEAYDRTVTAARRCAALEQCSVAGGVKGCRCPVSVRANAAVQVDSAAQEATCVQIERLYCPPLQNPRCEARICIADEARE